MAVQWSENLAVGVTMIDDQHKGIFSRINTLMSAMSQGKGKEEVGKVLEFLADYTKKHFSAEEKLMMESKEFIQNNMNNFMLL
ncbi:MAG: hemerythrin domain-containing protein [Planctomycetota bacterium]